MYIIQNCKHCFIWFEELFGRAEGTMNCYAEHKGNNRIALFNSFALWDIVAAALVVDPNFANSESAASSSKNALRLTWS